MDQKKIDIMKVSALSVIDSRILKENKNCRDHVIRNLFARIGNQFGEDHEKFNLEIHELERKLEYHDYIPAQTEFRISVNLISDEKLRYYQMIEKQYNRMLAEQGGFDLKAMIERGLQKSNETY